MSSMQITISLDSDAFQEDAQFELSQIFARIQAKLDSISDSLRQREVFVIHDTNGNSVGQVELEQDGYDASLSVPQRIGRVLR